MDKIPTEVLENIIDCIPGKNLKLAPYASVSRQFRAVIERRTFKELCVRSTNLDPLAAALRHEPARRSYLKILSLKIALPGREAGCAVKQLQDRVADSAAFSAAVRKVLETLKTDDDDAAPPLEENALDLRFRRIGDKTMHCRCDYHDQAEILQAVADSGRITLAGADELPLLPAVRSLGFMGSDKYICLPPETAFELARRMPNLSSLLICLRDTFGMGRLRRLAERNNFVEKLRGHQSNRIRNLTLVFPLKDMPNEGASVQQLAPPEKWEEEPLCMMIKSLSAWPLLTRLYLLNGATVHTHFFKSFLNTDAFPTLEELVVEFSPETADGRWFLQRDERAFQESQTNPRNALFWADYNFEKQLLKDGAPDENDRFRAYDDGLVMADTLWIENFRTLPDPDTFLPFLLDALAALQCLRKLRRFRLNLVTGGVLWGSSGHHLDLLTREFDLCYLKAGAVHQGDQEYDPFPKVLCDSHHLALNRVYWRTGTWTPWEEVQEACRNFVGEDAKVVFFAEEDVKYEWTSDRSCRQEVYTKEF